MSCGKENKQLTEVKQDRFKTSLFKPNSELLIVLHIGGACDNYFHPDEIVHFLGKYIEKKKLYDPKNHLIVKCANDLLGDLLGIEEFQLINFWTTWKLIIPHLVPATNKERKTFEQLHGTPEKRVDEIPHAELPWWFYVSAKKQKDENSAVADRNSKYEDSATVAHVDEDEELSKLENLRHLDASVTYQVGPDDITDDASSSTTPTFDSILDFQDRWQCTNCSTFTTALHGQCLRCFKPRQCRPCTLYRPPHKCHDEAGRKRSSQEVDDGLLSGTVLPSVGGGGIQSTFAGDERPHCSTAQDISSDNTIVSVLPDFSSNGDEEGFCDDPVPTKKRRRTPGMCLICNSQPNDALCVHGETSHQFACFKCAERLKRKGKLCPYCHRPIENVIRNFIIQETD